MERAFGLEIPLTLAEICHPERTGVLIYDMQIGIVSQISDGARILERVASVLAAARQARYRVFFTRHMSLPNEVAGVTQLRTAMNWQRVDKVERVKPPFLRDALGFPIASEVAPLPTEALFDKISMSAFVGTPLDIAFRDCGINSFVVLGIALEVGIEPTVRHGMDLGYIPIIVADACGYGDRAAAERSLATLAFTGGSVQTDTEPLIHTLQTSSELVMAG
jgi:biuret amidohydrolase